MYDKSTLYAQKREDSVFKAKMIEMILSDSDARGVCPVIKRPLVPKGIFCLF